jgi:hypothetical protein
MGHFMDITMHTFYGSYCIYIGPKEEIFAVEMPESVDGLGQAVLGQFPANSLPGSFSPYCEYKFAQKYTPMD